MKASLLNRKLHRWGAILTALPLLLILGTGMLLQFKKESDWIQPPTARGVGEAPEIAFERVLEVARSVPEAEITGWHDVDRLDVRPGAGIIKVRSENRWEIQIDSRTGDVLQTAYRRSDLIESLHDGSFFFAGAKQWVFFPIALILILVVGTGVWLFALPYLRVRRR